MSVLITLLVVGLVIVYLRSNRKARAKWLQNLSLPGHWVSQRDGTHLSLAGGFDAGEFTRQGHVERPGSLALSRGDANVAWRATTCFYSTNVPAGGDQPNR